MVPAVAAYACPRCYDLKPVGERIFVDQQMNGEQVCQIRQVVADARKRVKDFYGHLEQQPALLICSSARCESRLAGGGGKARAFGSSFVLVSPAGRNATVLSHELSHIELHGRVGLLKLATGALPAWLDEGIAVIVSRDDRYLERDARGQLNCRIELEGDLPASSREWRRQAGTHERPLYAMAACRVLEMMKAGMSVKDILAGI